MPISALVGR